MTEASWAQLAAARPTTTIGAMLQILLGRMRTASTIHDNAQALQPQCDGGACIPYPQEDRLLTISLMADADTPLERAREQLSAGAWADARASFHDAVSEDSSPEGLFGLAVAAWWLGDTETALTGWEHAYAASMERDDLERAVFSAVYLCLAYQMGLGNEAVATAWVDRAEELVAAHDLAPFTGWISMCRAHLANDHGRPGEAESWAREALDLARSVGDVDLELCATAELGTALVEGGRFEEGLGQLGRAMARALAGEATDLDAVVLIGCRMVTSCSRASDPKRALQWVRAADDFHDRYGSPHLFTTCRVHYGAVLMTTGAWDDAERELQAALEIGRRAEPALHAEATSTLARLRLAQGRVNDAERLLRGLESEPTATIAVAALLLARGEPAAAGSLVRATPRPAEGGVLGGLTAHRAAR